MDHNDANDSPVRVRPDHPDSPHPEALAPELLWPEGAPGWQDLPDCESTENREIEQATLLPGPAPGQSARRDAPLCAWRARLWVGRAWGRCSELA
jgi:hypothetical protein